MVILNESYFTHNRTSQKLHFTIVLRKKWRNNYNIEKSFQNGLELWINRLYFCIKSNYNILKIFIKKITNFSTFKLRFFTYIYLRFSSERPDFSFFLKKNQKNKLKKLGSKTYIHKPFQNILITFYLLLILFTYFIYLKNTQGDIIHFLGG